MEYILFLTVIAGLVSIVWLMRPGTRGSRPDDDRYASRVLDPAKDPVADRVEIHFRRDR